MKNDGIIATSIGSLLMVGLLASSAPTTTNSKEGFGNYPSTPQFYGNAKVRSLADYSEPDVMSPGGKQKINLNTGSQLLSYQIYQQAVNAATPTRQQLDSISGQSQQQTGLTAAQTLGGGLSSDSAPYNILSDQGPTLYSSEYQAVNFGSEQAQSISACAQNSPSFLSTSLLPSPMIPGQQTWNINSPDNILANQNFLSSVQQIGVDTTMGSRRNSSWDIRNNIPNMISVVSPWNNSTLLPDLEKRPLDCFVQPGSGIYGCAPSGSNQNLTY